MLKHVDDPGAGAGVRATSRLAMTIALPPPATIQPVGQITSTGKNLSSPRAKNIFVFIDGKSPAYVSRPVPEEGRLAIVTKRGAGCGGRGRRSLTSGADADGEVVWS
jgi:hypothetical protein